MLVMQEHVLLQDFCESKVSHDMPVEWEHDMRGKYVRRHSIYSCGLSLGGATPIVTNQHIQRLIVVDPFLPKGVCFNMFQQSDKRAEP